MKTIENAVVLTKEEYEALKKVSESAEIKPKEKSKGFWGKLCASKKILVTCWTITLILVLTSIYGFLFTDKDITPIVTLTGVMTACSAGDTAMYSWKAKAENKIKLSLGLIRSLAKEYGIESVLQLAAMVLSD